MTNKEKLDQEIENEEVNKENKITEEEISSGASDNVSDESFESGDDSDSLAEEVRTWQDKYMRLSAEFDNYRKRTLKEKMGLIESAGEDVIKSILAIADDFDRAAEAMSKSDDVESVKAGVSLIHHKLIEMLKQKGVSEIDAVGQDLDTDLHDAIAKFPAPDASQKGKIIDVVEKGYKLKDKVIRFSKVVVGE